MFHFHKWSDWSITERGKVFHFSYNRQQIGTYLIQERFCPKCGKTQINRQSTVSLHPNSYILVPHSHKITPKADSLIKPNRK